MNTTMYDKLLKLPLFQGLSRSDLTVILEKVKVEFRSYAPKECIVKQDNICSELFFVLDGTIRATATDSTYNFSLCEETSDQVLIEPYSLFGIRPAYTATYEAVTDTKTLVLKKEYIIPLLCKYEIFNLNFINLLSNRAQTLQQRLWNMHIGTTLEKIVNFLLMRCTFPYGKKELSITMEDLANLVDETRINVSRALNALNQIGYLSLRRKTIIINDLRNLIEEVQKQQSALATTSEA